MDIIYIGNRTYQLDEDTLISLLADSEQLQVVAANSTGLQDFDEAMNDHLVFADAQNFEQIAERILKNVRKQKKD